ncbi:MAG: insulinase family protein, partial [Desulfamplus sp.]|nr:insulinase family protein [Desulfamplus sp.]
LDFITTKVLNRFTAIHPDSEVAVQPRWKEPKKVMVPYPLSRDENPEKKYQACVAWLAADIKDSFEMLVLDVLEHILIGNSASPLRKKLIDSGLGSALSDGTGFDSDMRDTMFACGLKEIGKDDAEKVEKIIFDTLEELCSTGIEPNLLESAIHQIEFHKKEITNTPHPFGIKILISFAGTWIHGGDPVSCLKFDADLERLKQETTNQDGKASEKNSKANGKNGFLEGKIRQYFLDNPHRVLFVLAPDQEMEEKENTRIRQELQKILDSMTPEQMARINQDAEKLAKLQDAKEDVSVLPTLELSDVKPDIEIIRPDTINNIKASTCYDKATSDILYFTATAGIGVLPLELKQLVPFFCRAFTGAGTSLRDYARMAERMDLYTGGIGISPYSGTGFNGSDHNVSFLSLQGKALNRNIGPLFDITGELMSRYSFSDTARLKNLLLQYRSGMESAIVANGHRYAISLAARALGVSSQIAEMWHGISQFKFIKGLAEQPDIAEKLSSDLSAIAAKVFVRDNLKSAIAGDKDALILADHNIARMVDSLPAGAAIDFRQSIDSLSNDYKKDNANRANQDNQINQPAGEIQKGSQSARGIAGDYYPFEGWMTSTSVSFVAQAFKTVRMDHPDAPALAAISRILRSLYLHREIREKGGAYGGFAMYNAEEGIFSFASYRDPNIRRTLEVYRNACSFITSGDYTEEDIKEAILQVCADIDKPETPGPASIKAFYRTILGLTDEKRKEFKESLLGLDRQSIISAAEKYFTISDDQKGTAVISSREQLESANQNLKANQRELELLLINQ